MSWRVLVAIAGLLGCKQPVSYAPQVPTRIAVELTLADLSIRRVELEITLPAGYRQTSPGVHDATFTRQRDKAYFHVYRQSPIDDLGLHEAGPCGRVPGSVVGMTRLLHESLGGRGELELCESRDEDGPMQYWVRASVPVEDNWIECHGVMDGRETDHGDDASDYTEKQREQVLAVCRSMRIVSLGPRVPIDQQH